MKSLVLILGSAILFSTAPVIAADMKGLPTQSGCVACHKIDKKIVGPAWKDIAAKYKGQAGAKADLIAKVKKGGKGVWGPAPMPAYSPRVSDENIDKLVTFILSL